MYGMYNSDGVINVSTNVNISNAIDSCVSRGGYVSRDGFSITAVGAVTSSMSKNATSVPKKRLLTKYEKLDPKNIKKVIFNNPATIIIFTDDTKVVAKAHNEDFDEEKGFLMALSRVIFDTRADMNRIIDKGMEDSYK